MNNFSKLSEKIEEKKIEAAATTTVKLENVVETCEEHDESLLQDQLNQETRLMQID